MAEFDAPTQARLEADSATAFQVAIWLRARNRSTGAEETIGFWTGDDHREFEIAGETRLYFGAGAVAQVPPVRAGIGLRVQYHRIKLPPFTDEVRQALRVYDARGAAVEVHQVALDPLTGRPLGLRRMIKGVLNGAPEARGGKGQPAHVELVIASSARALTRKPPLMRSAAALALRDADDRFRDDVEQAGERIVPWGRAASVGGGTPTPRQPLDLAPDAGP